jgi:PAS domain S-box-containing protein
MLQKSVNASHAWPRIGAEQWAGRISLTAGVGVAYFLIAELGLSLLTATEQVAVFWPASGIAVGILIAFGRWACAPVAAGVIVASAAVALLTDRNVWTALAFGFCNAGEALLVMWLIERCFGTGFNLDSVRRVLGFLAVAALAPALAAIGASGAMQLFCSSTAGFLDIWKVWFASDALGIIAVAPLLIGVPAAVRDPPSWRELLEGTLAIISVAVVNGLALAFLSGPWSLMAPGMFLFPLLLWVSSRCRPVFAAAAAFCIAAIIVWTTIHEFGRYGDPTRAISDRVIAAQVAILGATLAALALAAVFAERRRHEMAVGEIDARLRSSLDAANVVVWDVDLIRDSVHSAGPVRRILHRPKGPVPRGFAEMLETIHPEDRDRVMPQFWAAARTGSTFRVEYRLNSDVLRWVTGMGSIEHDAHGVPVRMRGVTHDITDRKTAELALAERDAQLRLAGIGARVGSFAVDIGRGKVQTSPGYRIIHGLPEGIEEFPREEWRCRVHPDDLPRLDALRSLAFAERCREHNTEYRIIGPEGTAQWIESRALISYDGDGRPIRIVGVQIDITERKRVQVALEESEARYRALYDDNPSMYFTLDASGTVLSVNEFGARQLGYTPAELVGQSVLRVVHEEDLEAARQHLGKCAENIERVVTAELRKVHRDGRIVWVREVARAVPAGQQAVLLIVCEDITERKRAEEQQSLLVAELDHRVKNVLAGVAVVAMRTGERSGSKRDFIETLNHRLQSMAEAHALLSRNRWQGVSLADLVGQELAPFATAGNTDVEGPHVALTPVATQALAMVLHELATNAAKYGALSAPKGRVSVRWEWCQPASLKLEWHEQGGPVVTVPAQAGYGTSVIRDLIPYELGGTIELKFARDGVRCIVVIPDEQARHQHDVAHPPAGLAAVR